MKSIWRIVGIICAVVIAAGIVAALAGFVTGASTDRMIENVFGGKDEMNMIISLLKSQLATLV